MEKKRSSFIDAEILLLQAMRRLLRPLVRLFIKRNISLQVFIDLLKEIYVNVAEENLKKADIRITDSQVSLMTGVHRKDVSKYRGRILDKGAAIPHVSIGAELVAIWMGDAQYIDTEGRPSPLPYKNASSPEFSFSFLAEKVSKDVRPRAILDEMLRLNIVRYNDITDQVFLNNESYIPQAGWEEKLYYFGRNGEDHLEAAVTNILNAKPVYFDRSVYYDGLTEKSALMLEDMAREGTMKLLRAVNRRALQLSEMDAKASPDTAIARINFGAYFYTDAKDDQSGQGRA